MTPDDEVRACQSCGEQPVVVQCGEKHYCERCAGWLASCRVERAWAALDLLDTAVGAMLRAHFTPEEIGRAMALRLESGSGALDGAMVADWLRVDPPSLAEAVDPRGSGAASAVPPDFQVLEPQPAVL